MLDQLEQLAKDFGAIASQVPNIAKKALAAGSEVMEDELKETAPVYQGPIGPGIIPGMLRDSIKVEIQMNGTIIITSAPYGLYLEYGTSRMPAHPWIREAYEKCIDKVIDTITQTFYNGIQSIFLGGAL